MGGILHLPEEFLCNLAKSYLPREDLVNLCDSSSHFDFLRLYVPDILELKGEPFTVKGLNYSKEHQIYFLSPVIDNQRVRRITMSYRWKQGWGNSKGMLWMDVVRNGVTIASIKLPWFLWLCTSRVGNWRGGDLKSCGGQNQKRRCSSIHEVRRVWSGKAWCTVSWGL